MPQPALLDINDTRVDFLQPLPAKAHAFHGSRRIAFDYHVGVLEQFGQDLLAARITQIEAERALACIDIHEGATAVQLPRHPPDNRPGSGIALGPSAGANHARAKTHAVDPALVFDLDDVGTMRGQKPPCPGRSQHP